MKEEQMKTYEQMLKDMREINPLAGHMLICAIAQAVKNSEQWDDTEDTSGLNLRICPKAWKSTGMLIRKYLKDNEWNVQ